MTQICICKDIWPCLLLAILPILPIIISDYFAKHLFSFQRILIPTHSKCQLHYSKKSFHIFFISHNIILIWNLTISNVSIQILILILTHKKWSTHFTHFIWNGQNSLNDQYQIASWKKKLYGFLPQKKKKKYKNVFRIVFIFFINPLAWSIEVVV